MNRLQRTLALAGLVGVAGIGGALYIGATAPDQRERLRQKIEDERPFSFGRSTVLRFELERDGERIRFERDPAVGWQVATHEPWPADLQAVEALIDRTAGLRVKRIAFESPTEENLRNAGLFEPRLVLSIETRDGTRHHLAIGRSNPLTDLLHVRAQSGEDLEGAPVALVDPSFQWALDRPPEEFREDRLFPYRTRDVVRVRSRAAEGTAFVLEQSLESGPGASSDASGAESVGQKEPRFEVIVSGERYDAGIGASAVFLTALTKRLEAEEFLSDFHPFPELPPSIGSFAEGSKVTVDVVHAAGLTRSATIALAMASFNEAPQPIAWVDETVVRLYPPPVKEIVSTSGEQLRDRRISFFSTKRARRLVVEYGDRDEPWVFERDSDDVRSWRRVEPSPADASDIVLGNVVQILSGLEGDRTVSRDPSPAQLRAWLLEPPSRRFIVQTEDRTPIADVRIGGWISPEREELYVRGERRRVDAVSLDRVLKIPTDRSRFVTER